MWVVNKGNHPYHHAERFGELHFVTEGQVNVFSLDNLSREIWKKLTEGKACGEDYVLTSGYNIPNGIVMHFFLKKFKVVKLLAWGANRQKYQALTLPEPEDIEVVPNAQEG